MYSLFFWFWKGLAEIVQFDNPNSCWEIAWVVEGLSRVHIRQLPPSHGGHLKTPHWLWYKIHRYSIFSRIMAKIHRPLVNSISSMTEFVLTWYEDTCRKLRDHKDPGLMWFDRIMAYPHQRRITWWIDGTNWWIRGRIEPMHCSLWGCPHWICPWIAIRPSIRLGTRKMVLVDEFTPNLSIELIRLRCGWALILDLRLLPDRIQSQAKNTLCEHLALMGSSFERCPKGTF